MLEGSIFGKLKVLQELEPVRDNSGSLRRIVEVECSCGNISQKKLKYLKSGETTSCGNCKKIVVDVSAKGGQIIKTEPFLDEEEIIGLKYQRWTVKEAGFKLGNTRMVKAVCECGTEEYVNKSALKSGHSTSCGCYSREVTSEVRKVHGLTGERPYRIWANMIQRCSNPKHQHFQNYGGRGISFDPKWATFEGFWEDMSGGYSEDLELDRIDGNLNYTVSNCRWADHYTQGYNQKMMSTNTSGKTGVSFNKRTGHWVSQINVKGKRIYIGTYTKFEDAVVARETAEIKFYGELKGH